MDASILKNIINSDTPDNSSEEQTSIEDVEFPVTAVNLIDRLSKTFTRILSYKVSREAYQRYSVRLHVIDTLRDWSRVKEELGSLPAFRNTEQSCTFLIDLLSKYTTPKVLSNCEDVDSLTRVAEILLNYTATRRSLLKCLVRVIERIIALEQTKRSKKFLLHIVEKSEDYRLGASLVESIYVGQKSWLIEEPLMECFVGFCSNRLERLDELSVLFEKLTDSPVLFAMVSNQLKDMFLQTEYSRDAQIFISKVLDKVTAHCGKHNCKDTLDLYPTRLQFCVILMRIRPAHHTERSKSQTVQSLRDIFLRDRDEALILVSHFPDWLSDYLSFYEEEHEVAGSQSTCERVYDPSQ